MRNLNTLETIPGIPASPIHNSRQATPSSLFSQGFTVGTLLAYSNGRGILQRNLDGATFKFQGSQTAPGHAPGFKPGITLLFQAVEPIRTAIAVSIASTSFNELDESLGGME